MHVLPGATPAGVAAVRLIVGASGFVVLSGRGVLGWRGVLRQGPRGWLMTAVVTSVLTQWTFLLGMAWAGIAAGAVLHMGLCPVFTAVVERVSGKRCLTRRWFAVTATATAGCVALVLDAGGAGGGGGAEGVRLGIGVAAAVFSSFTYALFTVSGARVIEAGHPAGTVMSLVFAGTAAGLAPALLITSVDWVRSGQGMLAAAFLGLVATTLAYRLLGFGLRHLPASAVSTLALAEPATAVVVAVTALGERVGPVGWAGLTAVAVSLAVAVCGPRRRVVRLRPEQAEILAGLLTSAGRHGAGAVVEDVAAFLGATARRASRGPGAGVRAGGAGGGAGGGTGAEGGFEADPEHLWWRLEAWVAAMDHEDYKMELAKS